MKRRTRALAGSLLAASLLAGALSGPVVAQETEQPPPEGGSGNDNVVVAISTHDGQELFRVGLRITRATGQLVDASNGAAAIGANCIGCETIAAAYQVVLIFSDPQVVITENLAIALNLECDFCVTVAFASQNVFTTGGPVHFTAEGNRRLAAIRQRLHGLRNAQLTLVQLIDELEALAIELEDIVRTELVAAGPPSQPDPVPDPTPSATVEPTAEPSPEATAEETPSPSPSPTPEPSPSP